MKFMGYKKDAAKADAGIKALAASKDTTDRGQTALTLLNR
jgi:hypothetical protein